MKLLATWIIIYGNNVGSFIYWQHHGRKYLRVRSSHYLKDRTYVSVKDGR